MGTTRQRDGHERGAALLEMAIVALLLFMLIFGIIGYAYMMSFRSSLTQAAAEGARAGAVAPTGDATARATDAVERAIDGYGHGIGCGSGGLTCNVAVAACKPPATTPQCVTVTVDFQYRSNPLLPIPPGLGLTVPEHLRFTSVAEVN